MSKINNHITELTWFNAARYVPDTTREVVVLIRHRIHGTRFEYHLSEGQYYPKQCRWVVDSKSYRAGADLVTQWAEKDSKRGAIAIPEPFPSEILSTEPLSNLDGLPRA